jgi:hypothetical protein
MELRAYYWEPVLGERTQGYIGSQGHIGSDEETSEFGDSDESVGDGSSVDSEEDSELDVATTDDLINGGMECSDDMRCGIPPEQQQADNLTCYSGGWRDAPGSSNCPPGTEAAFRHCFSASLNPFRISPIGALSTFACFYLEMWANASDLENPVNVGEFPVP